MKDGWMEAAKTMYEGTWRVGMQIVGRQTQKQKQEQYYGYRGVISTKADRRTDRQTERIANAV